MEGDLIQEHNSPVFPLVLIVALLFLSLPVEATGTERKETPMHPSEHTISVVAAHDSWAVAALHCTDVTVFERGTRSQGMRFSGDLLYSSRGDLPSIWNGEQYASDEALLREGTSFVVIIVLVEEVDGTNWWKIIQADELEARDPVLAVEAVETAVEGLLDPTSGR